MHESEIILKLSTENPAVDDETLEEHMFAVLHAVEEYADSALGPVVAVDFDNRTIELAFSLLHDTQSQAQKIVSDVLKVIEAHTPVSFGETTTHVGKPPHEEHSGDLALV
ncbi:MAG TPA: hypothetical protein VGW75_16840 [Solirubrobacteraceae bacterium]|jgi:hypothetical protein|nr:hypothetical protein [Solirubrobacteraceae bacterium]